MEKLPKLVAIVGPTASGKTELGLALAKEFGCEIVSADSRQVYKRMNIGTDKPAGEWQGDSYMVESIRHHLIDIIEPDHEFTLTDFQKRAVAACQDIISRKKLPIVVGGTGLYISALVDNLSIPQVEPDQKVRQELENKPLPELVAVLKEKDPASAAVIDLDNPRRVIRALEVVLATDHSFVKQKAKSEPLFDSLQIGIAWPREQLYARIEARVDQQMKRGLLAETERLAESYGWSLPSMSSLGYKQMGCHLRGEMSLAEAVEILKRDSRHYARRQLTWFRRDKRIKWLGPSQLESAQELVNEFLK